MKQQSANGTCEVTWLAHPGRPNASALLLSAARQRPLQLLQHHRPIGLPREDRLDNAARDQGKPQGSADIAFVDMLGLGDLSH